MWKRRISILNSIVPVHFTMHNTFHSHKTVPILANLIVVITTSVGIGSEVDVAVVISKDGTCYLLMNIIISLLNVKQ